MKKQLLKITSCALLIAILMAPVVKASEIIPTGLNGADLFNPATATTKVAPGGGSKKYPYANIQKRISNYQVVNKEVVGWLTIPGTNINSPINYSNKNNSYYIRRDWSGVDHPDLVYENWTQKPATANYIDYRTKFGKTWEDSSRNIVIYGHNWNNLRAPFKIGPGKGPDGNELTMFAELPSYTDINFAKKNPYIYFSTGTNEGIWKVFAVGYCELSPKFAYNSPNPGKDGLATIIKEWKQRSIYNFDTEVSSKDRILTLSTCTRQYNVGSYQRYVVVARLLREGETEKDPVAVTVNPNPVAPKFN